MLTSTPHVGCRKGGSLWRSCVASLAVRGWDEAQVYKRRRKVSGMGLLPASWCELYHAAAGINRRPVQGAHGHPSIARSLIGVSYCKSQGSSLIHTSWPGQQTGSISGSVWLWLILPVLITLLGTRLVSWTSKAAFNNDSHGGRDENLQPVYVHIFLVCQ